MLLDSTSGWALGITFDTLVIILTLLRTFRLAMQSKRLGMKDSLIYMIARDGKSYAIISSCCKMINY